MSDSYIIVKIYPDGRVIEMNTESIRRLSAEDPEIIAEIIELAISQFQSSGLFKNAEYTVALVMEE